jgi:hypothetical protein
MYAPATPAELKLIHTLGLPDAGPQLRYYVVPGNSVPNGPTWDLEFTASIAHTPSVNRWSDLADDYNVKLEQVEETGTDVQHLIERLATIDADHECDEDSAIEVTLDAAFLTPARFPIAA